eukprot:TRINITY_DN8324_c0_g2_i1.p1 TRINITY_DN8324_c0_g2~~TRINITY_DN8324_c0_g2_i1.p1  ORF type:complete len:114 (-),score=4.57 TRINITY_DN8324_c0_g2_i1:130-471(-)
MLLFWMMRNMSHSMPPACETTADDCNSEANLTVTTPLVMLELVFVVAIDTARSFTGVSISMAPTVNKFHGQLETQRPLDCRNRFALDTMRIAVTTKKRNTYANPTILRIGFEF